MRTLQKLLLFSLLSLFVMASCSKKNEQPAGGTIDPMNARYRIEGTFPDASEPVITWPGNTYEYSLEPASSTQATLISKDLGIAGHLISHGGSLSYYAKFGLLVNFDPATNKITSITNSYGQPSSSGRSAVLDPSGINAWDPATKTISIKYWMDQTGVTGHKTSFNEKWIYIGAR